MEDPSHDYSLVIGKLAVRWRVSHDSWVPQDWVEKEYTELIDNIYILREMVCEMVLKSVLASVWRKLKP